MKEVALFDFDGTLTRKSTIVLFYTEVLGLKGIVTHAPWLLFHSFLYLFRFHDFEAFMTMCADRFLKGLEDSALASVGLRLAEKISMNEQVVNAFDTHVRNGDHVAVVTGGFGYIAKAWVKLRNVDCVVFSSQMKCENDAYGPARLFGCDYICIGKRKLAAIGWARSWGRDVIVCAYGNSSGDYEMLRASDRPYWVSKRGVLLKYSSVVK